MGYVIVFYQIMGNVITCTVEIHPLLTSTKTFVVHMSHKLQKNVPIFIS